MSCCLVLTKALSQISPKEEDDVVTWQKNRPERTGKWFVVHKSLAKTIITEIKSNHDHDNNNDIMIDIWENFFSKHPVGDEYCKNFVSICLTDDEIQHYQDKIRLASYRWEDIQGVGEKKTTIMHRLITYGFFNGLKKNK